MHKLGFWLYQPYKYLILYPLFLVDTIVFATLAVVLSTVVSARVGSLMGVAWSRVVQFLTPMFVSVSGREHMVKGQSYVVVANHQSAFDIIVLYGNLGIDFKWIMKKELRNAPFLGWSCARLDHIFIDRSSPRAAYRSIQRAKEILTNGTSVVIFPEGTRSKDGHLGVFKHGAFKMAFEMGLPILPITIDGTHRIMGQSERTLMPGRVRLTIHPAIDTAMFHDNREALTEASRQAVASGLSTR